MHFKRSDRVGELLRHEISRRAQEIKDPRLGFVTITGVRIDADLSVANVFYSVYGSEEERRISGEILKGWAVTVRRDLGKKLESLRRIPVLDFVYDDTPAKAQKVLNILHYLSGEEKPPAEPTVAPQPPRDGNSTRAKRRKRVVR